MIGNNQSSPREDFQQLIKLTQKRPERNTILCGAKKIRKMDALLILIFETEDGFHFVSS